MTLKLKDTLDGKVTKSANADAVPWSGVTGKPSAFTPASHNHDDRYYTESEIDSKLTGVAVSGHTHTKSQITDFPASLKNPNSLTISLNGTSQGAYDGSAAKSVNVTAASVGAYTKSEVDTKLATKYGTDVTRTKNTVLAAPAAANGSASFRALTAADIPAVNASAITGTIAAANLPSYVDDVLEYNGTANFPATGETGKIYTDTSTNKIYRWGGSSYVVISDTIALGETSATAYRGDRGKIAYDHSQKTSGNPHNVTKSDVGLGSVENKSSATIRGELTKANVTTALGYTPPTTNTTYSAGTGISLSGTTFSNSGVRSVATGGTNGTISVNTNGTAANVAVKGLGTSAYKTTRTLTAQGAAGWKDAATDSGYVPDMAFMAYWNGAYSGTASNLAYCNKGAFGTAAIANKTDFAAASHTHSYLPLSGGTVTGTTYFTNGIRVKAFGGTSGTAGYALIATIKISSSYQNSPIELTFSRRGDQCPTRLSIGFTSVNSSDPGLNYFKAFGATNVAWLYKSATSTWQLYIQKSEGYDTIDVLNLFHPSQAGGISITWGSGQVSSIPSGSVQATYGYNVNYASSAGYATSAGSSTTASKLGGSTVGGAAKPIYLNSGTATACSSTVGSATQPVYMNGGQITACSYTLGKSVPSNAVFTDTNTWTALKGSTTSAAGTAGYAPAPAAGTANRYLRCDGTWTVPPDNNTTYSAMKGASTSAAGSAGLVPAPAAGAATRYLRSDGTWQVPPNTNTTYSAGTGISLSGTTFSNSGVRSVATGSSNGTISVNTNGITANVAVKGLGSAAYTASTAYAAASHTHSYLPLTGGTVTSALAVKGKLTTSGGLSVGGGTAIGKIYFGSIIKTVTSGSDSVLVWSTSELSTSFGGFSSATDALFFMNADGAASALHIEGAVLTSAGIYCCFNVFSEKTHPIRLNYLLIKA